MDATFLVEDKSSDAQGSLVDLLRHFILLIVPKYILKKFYPKVVGLMHSNKVSLTTVDNLEDMNAPRDVH